MSEVTKERRLELLEYASNGECACPTKEEVRTLVNMADERDALLSDHNNLRIEYDYLFDEAYTIRQQRDRYRALLIVAGSVLSEDGDTTEADARALYRRIESELNGENQ